MNIHRCKGSRDFSPAEMLKFRFIEQAFRKSCLNWGYREVRTPTLEYLHLFTSTGTLAPGMLNKVYSFLDWDGWSGERVVLRPDGTIPLARYFIDNLSNEPLAKLFYVSNTFIFEQDPEKAREHWQGGVELIGPDSPTADVELMAICLEVLNKLNVGKPVLKLSHAGIIRAMLAGLNLGPEEQDRIFEQLLDGNTDSLAELESSASRPLLALIDMRGSSSGILKNLKAVFADEFPALVPQFNDFISITKLLDNLNCSFEIDLDVGRGFEYYTGIVFHLNVAGQHVGGGGRYNALIPLMSGKQIPASGFALYLDLLMELVKENENPARGIEIMIDENTAKPGLHLIEQLHNAGLIAEFNLGETEMPYMAWTVDLRQQPHILTNRVTRESIAGSSEEILRKVRNESTGKNSPS